MSVMSVISFVLFSGIIFDSSIIEQGVIDVEVFFVKNDFNISHKSVIACILIGGS